MNPFRWTADTCTGACGGDYGCRGCRYSTVREEIALFLALLTVAVIAVVVMVAGVMA